MFSTNRFKDGGLFTNGIMGEKYLINIVIRIIQLLYYAPAGRHINAWMHSLKKSVKPEIVNRYDLWLLRHKIGGAKVFVNNVQWSDQIM